MRYFIYLSYDGSQYHGWQVQPNAVSVQQKLNEALSLILRENIDTLGAGRTDAGVNAAMMVAHFDTEKEFSCPDLAHKLCRILPQDIAVSRIKPVTDAAHARFDATSRTYHYDVYLEKNPFIRHYAVKLNFPLDFALMNRAASRLLQVEDFTSFSKVNTDTKTNICHLKQARWFELPDGRWRFEITADRFLRNMVRAIVGTLIDVGRGRTSLEEFERIISSKDRCRAGESMPGKALSLVNITYPEDIFKQV